MNKRFRIMVLFLMLASIMGLALIGCQTVNPGEVSYSGNYELKILGNSDFLAGSQGALRIIAFEPGTGAPASGVPVNIYMENEKKENGKPKENEPEENKESSIKAPLSHEEKIAEAEKKKNRLEKNGKVVFSGKTDSKGTLNAKFDIPGDRSGSVNLTVLTGGKTNMKDIELKVNISKKFKIYLTTDKPLYQPGQVINIRALALNIPSMKPLSGKEIVFEVMDGKGNKVFKQKGETSKFGIYSAEFQLADEVNMGDYQVFAYIESEKAEKNVTVKKYVLPKFKVDFEKDRKFYSPGQTIKGKIDVNYFFGKPVAEGKVLVKLNTFDYEFVPVAEVKGVTDREGKFDFEVKIPDYLVGQPLEKGGAAAKLDIEVIDTADHKETAVRMITVSSQSLKVELFPESGGVLKHGLDNMVYVLSSTPDGTPVKATVDLGYGKESVKVETDEAGIGSFAMKPVDEYRTRININASTVSGDSFTSTVYLNTNNIKDNIIIRTDKASYKVGETMKLQILSTRPEGDFYVDFIRNQQVILNTAFDGKTDGGKYSLEITPDMEGMLAINAYFFAKDNNIIRDGLNIFVAGNQDLKIEVKPEKDVFKPGEEGKINFMVSDGRGKPAAVAMGVDIVDEAVFAMGEMMPGFEKVYFLLESQLMDPKYEIHGYTVPASISSRENIQQNRQDMEKILFSKIPSDQNYKINIDTYQQQIIECFKKMQKIQNALLTYNRTKKSWPREDQIDILVSEKLLTEEDLIDPWGNRFVLTPPTPDNNQPGIRSAGPGGAMDDKDDLDYLTMAREYWKYNDHQRGRRFEEGMIMDEMRLGAVVNRAPGIAMEKSAMMDMSAESAPASGGGGQQKQVRVREYFPETLYTNPQVITDDKGRAQISLAMADSITTWRLTAFANSMEGLMGNTTAGIRVFQDFFIDIDFPVALTQGDRVAVPIAIYNYLKEDQTVKLKVDTSQKWFELLDEGEISVKMKPDEVSVAYFSIIVKDIGRQKFTVTAEGTKFSDAIRREIEILPDGEMVNWTKTDKISQKTDNVVRIPANAVPKGSKIMVYIYPGMISQVVDGLEKVFRMPSGCFEQTTATTYPNALVMEYLKKNKKLTPEMQMTAEGYLNTGYQRLVSFEVQGGGFSWFGNAPANQCLTAMGIMQFRDMKKVRDVDEDLIVRTQRWLASQQNQDGSWSPDSNYAHAETWSKLQGGGKIPVTAYIVWALAESGYEGQDLDKGMEFLKKNSGQIEDPYILALICNAMAKIDPDNQFTKEMIQKLIKQATVESDQAYWGTNVQTVTYSSGNVAKIETTALAALALMNTKGNEQLADKAISYIIKNKDSYGTWYSTQSTILSMKALLLSQEKAGSKINAKVHVTVNGQRKESFELTPENYDVFRQADFGDITLNGDNKVEITMEGEGNCFYQISARYYMPWTISSAERKPLDIKVSYDRTTLKADDMITSEVSVRNNTPGAMKMVMVDLGVPPGFTVMTPDLNEYVKVRFEKYTMTSRQIIIYIDTLEGGQSVNFKYRLKARYPMKAKTPESKVYQYYNPDIEDVSKPVTLEVGE